MAQFARPDADLVEGGWTTAPLWEKVDETSPDAEFINGPNKANGTCELRLSDVSDPLSSSTHVMRVYGHVFGTPVTGINLYVELYDGATLIKQWLPAMTTTDASFSYTLTSGEADNIGDYTDLRVHLVQDYITGPQGRAYISWFEFEVPDAISDPQIDKTDGVAIGDTPTVALGDLVDSELDDIAVGETIAALLISQFTQIDGVAIGDLTILVLDDLAISVQDNATIGDQDTLSQDDLVVLVSDSLLTGDDAAVEFGQEPDRNVSELDGVAIGEIIFTRISDLAVSKTDNINLGETVTLNTSLDVTGSSSLIIGDSLSVSISNPEILVFDSILVGEYTEILVPETGVSYVSEADDIALNEILAVALDDCAVSITDTLAVGDSVFAGVLIEFTSIDTLSVGEVSTIALADLGISEIDGVLVGDILAVEVPLFSGFEISETESVSIGETIFIELDDLVTSITDGMIVGEISAVSFDIYEHDLSVMDNLLVGEFISLIKWGATHPKRILRIENEDRSYSIWRGQ